MNPGLMEGFVGIDVADAGKAALVEEYSLDPGPCGPEDVSKIADPDHEGLRPQGGVKGPALQLPGAQKGTVAELALVMIEEPVLVGKVKNKVRVFVNLALRAGRKQEFSGHLEVKDQMAALVQVHDQQLGPAAH
jgi:hypothetical protein